MSGLAAFAGGGAQVRGTEAYLPRQTRLEWWYMTLLDVERLFGMSVGLSMKLQAQFLSSLPRKNLLATQIRLEVMSNLVPQRKGLLLICGDGAGLALGEENLIGLDLGEF